MIRCIVVLCAIHMATSSLGPDKLMSWFRENSEVFVMLKHWDELPLIASAWKRLKDTPQVVEDRRAFINSFQALLEPMTTHYPLRNKSLNISLCDSDATACQPVVNTTTESPKNDSPLPGSNDDVKVFNIDAKVEQLNQPIANDSPEVQLVQPSAVSTPSSLSSPAQDIDPKKTLLEDYYEEKKWIRSQLIPLNYLFEKVKAIEDEAKEMRIAIQESQINGSSSMHLGRVGVASENSDPPSIESRLQKIESLTQTLAEDYKSLKSQVLESINASMLEVSGLKTKVDRLGSMRPAHFKGNGEEGEYCPERLDEMVPCSEVGDSCYCFSKQQKNWTEALQYCEKNNMYLLSLETQKETEALMNHIKQSGLPKDFYWTSGSDEANEGDWVWIASQQNFTFTNWRSNQPDGGRKENCLYLHSRDDFKWGDWMCNLAQQFICEW